MDKALTADRRPPDPYEVSQPTALVTPLVFASPHSGRHYPESFLAASKLGRHAIRKSEDAFVDWLLAPAQDAGVPILKSTYARAYVDLNRAPEELDASMFIGGLPSTSARRTSRVAAGLGAVAKIVAEGEEIYRAKLPASEAIDRISQIHRPYHTQLRKLLEQSQRRFGFSVLLDWHSMPSAATAPNVDVVIGDRFGASCNVDLTTFLHEEFRSQSLRTEGNFPFAGGYTTEHYGDPIAGRHTVQIEVKRSLYMDERTFALAEHAGELQSKLGAITHRLITALQGPLGALLQPDTNTLGIGK